MARGPDFQSMLSLSFDAITEHAADHVEVYERLAAMLGLLAHATTDSERRAALSRQLDIVAHSARRVGLPRHRREAFGEVLDLARARLAGAEPPTPATVLAPTRASGWPEHAG